MAKKLMAILGANVYSKTKYVIDTPGKQKYTYTGYYSTAAVAQALFSNIKEYNDCYVIVFLTEKARKYNWEDRLINYAEKSVEKNKGLNYELLDVVPQLSKNIKTVRIKDGKNTAELWSIVNTFIEEIEDGDEVYLDITTGFRSIPLLSLLVINYARIIKNDVKIKGIYYGAFEAKDELLDHTPIFDLWPMIEVADWSYAIYSFIKHGSAGEISDLLESSKDNAPGKPNYNYLRLGNLLQQFSDNIHMTRGYDLIFNYDYEKLNNCINIIMNNNETISYPVAKGLIEKIKFTVNHYFNNNVINGFSAVKWCIEHNMVHQGFILLQETVVTCLIVKGGLTEKKFINNYNLRNVYKRAIEIKYNEEKEIYKTLTFKDIKNLLRSDGIISGLFRLWADSEGKFSPTGDIKNLIKNVDASLEDHFDKIIDNNSVIIHINELRKANLSLHMPKEKEESLIDFIDKCLSGFAKINSIDKKYSYLMHELSKVRNHLAHGGFNDREISDIIYFRGKWNPDSNLLKQDIKKISFIGILKDICDNMEDIINYDK